MSDKEIIIRLQYKINYLYFENVLLEIMKYFQDSTIKFAGYLNSCRVLSIDGTNYRVYPGANRIKLTLTTDKNVKIPSSSKQKAFKKYTEFLESIKG